MIKKFPYQFLKYQVLPAAALILLLVMVAGIYWVDKGIRDLKLSREDYQALQARNQQIEAENKELRRIIYRLKHDLRYIEAITRLQLGGIREGELIFKLPDEQNSDN